MRINPGKGVVWADFNSNLLRQGREAQLQRGQNSKEFEDRGLNSTIYWMSHRHITNIPIKMKVGDERAGKLSENLYCCASYHWEIKNL